MFLSMVVVGIRHLLGGRGVGGRKTTARWARNTEPAHDERTHSTKPLHEYCAWTDKKSSFCWNEDRGILEAITPHIIPEYSSDSLSPWSSALPPII